MFEEGSDFLSPGERILYGAGWWLDAFNPFSMPSEKEEFVKKGAAASIVYGAAWIVSGPLSGGGSQAFIDFYGKPGRPTMRQMGAMKIDTYRNVLKFAARTAHVTAYAAVPIAIAGGTTYAYEKKVNEPIRKSHGGSQGTWFGPLGGSGFGTVV